MQNLNKLDLEEKNTPIVKHRSPGDKAKLAFMTAASLALWGGIGGAICLGSRSCLADKPPSVQTSKDSRKANSGNSSVSQYAGETIVVGKYKVQLESIEAGSNKAGAIIRVLDQMNNTLDRVIIQNGSIAKVTIGEDNLDIRVASITVPASGDPSIKLEVSVNSCK